MTIQEAIKDIKSIKPIVGGKSLEIAIECMKEVEQYRALGTVEEIKKKIKTELPYMSIAQARFKSELDDYRNLGTVEELKEAREKQVAKKVFRQKGECYAKTIDGKEYHEQILVCPNCHRAIKRTEALDVHCKYCGQKLDWEEGGTSD